MELTLERLVKFDLVEKAEESLMKEKTPERLIDLIDTVQKIDGIDQFIKESPSFPGSTEKIIRSELISAIGATLAIEGTRLKEEEIEESFRKASLKEKLRRSEQEAENSRKVYAFIIDLTKTNKDHFEYSEQLIKQIHKYFTNEMDYPGNVPGEYRSNFAVTFGLPRRTGLCKTRAEIDLAMSNFVNWLTTRGKGILSCNSIVKAIMAHYYLTEIHPFGDGNGRTARAIEALILYLNGINDYCFWSLANFWSFSKEKYSIHLGDIRTTCNPWDFIIWGLKGYLDQIARIKGLVLKKVKQLMLMDYAKYLLENKQQTKIKINKRIICVLPLLIRIERVSLLKFQSSPEVLALYSNSSSTTKLRDFRKMADLGLINLFKKDEGVFIEPNFHILERIKYNV